MTTEERVLFWLPLEHSCGCIIDWGCDVDRKEELVHVFFPAIAPFPCPMHGSASGKNSPPLEPDEVRYQVAHNFFYRMASEDQHENGRRNRSMALSNRVDASGAHHVSKQN